MAGSVTATAELSQNPYVGPRAFEEEESHFFFGRDEETEILTSLVMTRRSALFYAQSGAGKSSLLRAGLIPELTRQRTIGRGRRKRVYQKMRVLPIATVGGVIPKEMDQPIANIYIFSALYAMQPDANPNELAGLTLSQGLKPWLKEKQEPEPGDQEADTTTPPARLRSRSSLSTLLIFDQFEEIFTTHATRWPERKAFFQQVRQALEEHESLHMLFTTREDHIAELTPYLNLMPGQLRDRFRLERLKRDAALQAVKEPAHRASRTFAENVAEDLVDNLRRTQTGQKSAGYPSYVVLRRSSSALGAYVEPVHLQIVCRQLWANLPPDRTTILAEDVEEFGDVDQALIGFYEDTLQGVMAQTDISQRRLRTWFDTQLITSARTRGLVYRGEEKTEGLPNEAIGILNEAYIIRADIRGGDTWYELAHDRLVEPILEANWLWRETYHNPLAAATQAWLGARRNSEKLLDGAQLEEAQAYARDHPADVTGEEKELLAESIRQEEAEQELARQAAKRRRNYAIAAISVIVVLTFLSFLAWRSTIDAQNQKATAEAERANAIVSRETAVAAKATAEWNEKLAVASEAQAKAAEKEAEKQAEIAKEEATISRSRQLAVQFTSELSKNNYELALLLAIESGRSTDTLEAFSAIRTAIANTYARRVFYGHTALVTQATWSQDERRILTHSGDGTARVWDAETGDELVRLEGDIWQATWSQDERRILTAGCDRREGASCVESTARVWDAETGDELVRLEGHIGWVSQATWSQDERRILTRSDDGTARVWETETGNELVRLEGHTGEVRQATWSQDERRILTSSGDGTARVWDAETGDELVRLEGHIGLVRQATWSQDERRILTGSNDDTARVWETETGDELVRLDRVWQATWSQDERRILTRSADGTAQVWDAETGDELVRLEGHTWDVSQATWSQDERRILTAGCDRREHIYCVESTARVWDAETGDELVRLEGHTWDVSQATWSQDERRILTRSADGTVRIWYDRMADLIEATCRKTPRNMTWDEWRRLMGDEPYRPTCDGAPIPPGVVEELTAQGVELVQAGDVVTAVTRLAQVLALPPTAASNPEAAAHRHLAPALARAGQIEAAITAIEEARALDPEVEISASAWNTLCRYGSLWEYAADVMDACKKAVELAPDNGGYRDSRGLARALTGDYAGAIEDFEFYVEWSPIEKRVSEREAWIAELQAGRNPFDEATLEELR